MVEQHDMSVADDILAWCFLPRDSRWRRRDQWGDRLLVTPGKIFRATDMREMRRRHLDAWEWALDALHHASGLVACRVRLSGVIEREGHPRYYISHGGGMVTTRHGGVRHLPITYEGVGRKERLYAGGFQALWTGDATLVLHRFACDLAERSLEAERAAGREPDERAWAAVAARRSWLTNTLDDDGLRTAWDALDAASREYKQRDSSWPSTRLMTEDEAREYSAWRSHAVILRTVQVVTEPVPLGVWGAVYNVKHAIRAHWIPFNLREPQQQRVIAQQAAEARLNAELEDLLIAAFA